MQRLYAIFDQKRMKYLLLITLFSFSLAGKAQNFTTVYEESGFVATAEYSETIEYCRKLAEKYDEITYSNIGQSAGGFDIPLIVADKHGFANPEKAKASGKTILMVQSGIHPGESEGKDAMMMLLRDALLDEKEVALPENVTIVWIPVLNVDGDNRFGPNNRINQNGPEEMGWRTNSLNLNLNRDYLKADTPELRHWLKLWNEWLPDFFIDCHTTDGADYQYALTYAMEIYGGMDKELMRWQEEEYIAEVMPKMFEAGFPVFPYVSFRRWHDPRSGLRTQVSPPRISQGYTAIQNRPGLLIETHMLKPYKNRVESTYKMIELSLEFLSREGEVLQKLNVAADKNVESKAFREKPFVIDYRLSTQDSVMVDFMGIDYHVEKSDLTGGNWFRYHNGEEKTFQLPWFKHNIPAKEILLPEAYLVPQQYAEVIERLEAHGVKMHTLSEPKTLDVEVYKFTDYNWRSSPYEGRMLMNRHEYEVIQKRSAFREGTFVVPVSQRTARVIANILEPAAPDSYVYWGFFNSIFEQKEYAETYVMEKEARQMLRESPQLKEAFESWKKENPDAAQNQWAQLNWFYQRSPWWDKKKDVYPVVRVMDASQLD